MIELGDPRFWAFVDRLAADSELAIDRPRGCRHPRRPEVVYPLDYGYLVGTTGGDGEGVDAWRGSLPDPAATAVIVTVDLVKRDAEVKLLLGCTPAEARQALATHTQDNQAAVLIERPQDEPA